MEVGAEKVKELREKSGAGLMDCKRALQEAGGDLEKAHDFLRKSGVIKAAKKAGRATLEGLIGEAHSDDYRVAAVIEVNCETDFVARSEDFCKFTRELALHIAAVNPKYIKKEDVPADVLAKETDKEAYYKANCLLAQAYVKDPGKSIQDLLNELVSKIGENTIVSRFIRYKVGE